MKMKTALLILVAISLIAVGCQDSDSSSDGYFGDASTACDNLVGSWANTDYVFIFTDSTYTMLNNGVETVNGDYTMDNGLLTITDTGGIGACQGSEAQGTYQCSSTQSNNFTISVVDDTCTPRADFADGSTWQKQ